MSKAPDELEPFAVRIAVVVVLGMIMSILDTTIVNVALASLSRDLHTTLNSIQWVVSAYLLALAAVIPLSGWMIRRFGAFRVYMNALILFTAGSALCGLATTSSELIAFRAVQGVGGGLLAPTGMTILVQAVGRDQLPRVMSAMGVPMVLAPVFGPTLGGFLLQSVSWHAIFMINVPVGIATAVVSLRMLPRDRPEPGSAGRLDWIGFLLAALGTVGITYGLSESATAGSFASRTVIVPILVGVVMIAAFIVRARRISYALLDLRLYAIRTYSAATAVMFCLGAALFAAMILLPLYFQDVRGDDALRTGILLIPQGAGGAIGMNRSAWATTRFGAGPTSLAGLGIMVAGTAPFLFVGPTTSYSLIAGTMVVRGIGVGLASMPAMTAAFAALDHDQVGDASPQLNVIQRVGGSLGTAVIVVLLQVKLTHAAASAKGHATLGAIASSFDQTYLWVIVLSLLAFVPGAVLWRQERRLRLAGVGTAGRDDAFLEVLT